MIKWKHILGSNQFGGVKQMYTVAFLQDFSVPLICWCALEITREPWMDFAVSADLLHTAIPQRALVLCRAQLGKS